MKTRLFALTIILCSVLAVRAFAQASSWNTVSYDKWGFALQIPSGCAKQPIDAAPDGGACDLYAGGGLAYVIRIIPAPGNVPTSTAIEQAIQAEIKAAARLGSAKRWEQDSKQGDLFKGFIVPIALDADDTVHAAVGKIVGPGETVQCASMAPVSDDNSPILRIEVIGPKGRQADVVSNAKGMVAFVSRGQASPAPARVETSNPQKLIIERKPDRATPKPAPAKPWPTLKKGEIELAGVVDSIAPDGRNLSVVVDLVTMPGDEPVALSPARPKRVLLKIKQTWLTVGQRIRIKGTNTGVGKPIIADALEQTQQTPSSAPKPMSSTIPA